jgi:integrase
MASKSSIEELRAAITEYLQIRRTLGFKLERAEHLLFQFADFIERKKAPFITTTLSLKWATESTGCQPGRWAQRLSLVRCFARFRQTTDPRTEVPPARLLPRRYRRNARDIHSDEDVLGLLQCAQKIRSPKGLWNATYYALLGLLAVTGMRVGEAVALDCNDVDLNKGVITIRNAKFGKSRALPIHPSTTKVLKSYANLRKRRVPAVETSSFFVSERGARLRAKAVGKKYLVLARQAGIRGPKGRSGPRLHDLRHRFAIRTLLAWYHTGVDVERRLPVLSTYLGHANTANTYWYLSSVPELLYLAAQRLAQSSGESST